MSTPFPNGLYAIRNVATNTLLNVFQGASLTGVPIVGLPQQGTASEQWVLDVIGGSGNEYTFANHASGTFLDLPVSFPHVQIIGRPPVHLVWFVVQVSEGQYTIGLNTDFVVNLWDEGIDQYSPVTLEGITNGTSQLFTFERR